MNKTTFYQIHKTLDFLSFNQEQGENIFPAVLSPFILQYSRQAEAPKSTTVIIYKEDNCRRISLALFAVFVVESSKFYFISNPFSRKISLAPSLSSIFSSPAPRDRMWIATVLQQPVVPVPRVFSSHLNHNLFRKPRALGFGFRLAPVKFKVSATKQQLESENPGTCYLLAFLIKFNS